VKREWLRPAVHAGALGFVFLEPVLGDPAAFVVGTGRTWRARLPWNRRKSWAGTAAFLLPAWAGGLATLWAVSGMPPDGHTRLYAVLMTGVAAAVGAIVESLPLPVDDNIPVTLAVGGVLSWMTTGL
jgi:dolichol kinase